MQKILPWIATIWVLLVGFGTIYVVAQQVQRNDANWPQIQLAQDTVRKTDSGGINSLLPPQAVDISQSLAVFTNIYDKSGKPLAGSGYLDGKLAKIDPGVLDHAKGKDYNAVTWQPKKDVRIAAVAVAGKDYYVVSGRNMKEVEKNENTSLILSALGFAISIILIALLAGVNHLNRLRQHPNTTVA
jgi:hypothetical protein